MKRTLANITLVVALGAIQARADYNPINLTPGSYTADVIVEKTAAKSINEYVNSTMEGGTNNNNFTFYETGYVPSLPWTGLPVAGSTFASITDPVNHQFKMPPSYAANNAVMIGNYAGFTTGTLTLTTPTALTTLSILATAGTATTVNYTIHYAGGGTQAGSQVVDDWTGGTTIAWYSNGRVSMENGTLASLAYTNGTNRRLLYYDIALTDTVNNVTSIDFAYVSGGRAAIFGLSGSTGGAFAPLTVTGFTRDMVVEASAPRTGFDIAANVTMDNGGAVNTGFGWFEQGFYRVNGYNSTNGLPTNGTSFTTGPRTFTMAPDYTVNNVFFIANSPGFTTNTITLSAPAAYTMLSFLCAAGNGPTVVNLTVHHSADPDETLSISAPDWFNTLAPMAWLSSGRYRKEDRAFDNVGTGNVRLFPADVVLTGLSSVTSIDLSYASGGTAAIFALSGANGGNTNSIAVTGYNKDAIVERTVPLWPSNLTTATTVTMDGGTNNTGNTWYEVGYYGQFTNSGFPAAGSTLDSQAQPDHHYKMPSSYSANNAVFVDATFTNRNLTLASPAAYSALSFLSATANGNVTNQVIMQYQDGTSETNTFISRDWFNNTPYAYSAFGRLNVDNKTINADPGRAAAPSNPRLYEAQFALGNVVSPVTNVVLKYLNPSTSNARMFVFAVSATAGALAPIINSVSISATAAYEGSNVVFNAVMGGGTAPITYQWQKGTNGVYVNVLNGGNVSGATTTNMVITATLNDPADYRMVASNVAGSVNSGVVTLVRVVSPIPDVTGPADTISIQSFSTPGNENVSKAIDNTTSKYLNFDLDAAAPFIGPVGFVVKPATNSIVSILRLYTANDAEERDPTDYLLEGSNDGGVYTTISSGALALPTGRNAAALALNPLTQNLQEVRFVNSAGYSYYRVTFTNVKNATTANSMQIGEAELLGYANPNPPPSFTISPGNVTTNEGTTAKFTSLATGPGPITYQWYDVTAGDPGVAVGGATSANLILPAVTTGMNGNKYRVVATNPNGSVTNPSPAVAAAQLTVISGPPTVETDLPAETVAYTARTLVLSPVIGGTSPTYQWQSNGVNMVNAGRIAGVTSSTLYITNVQASDRAVYQLQSSNQYGGPIPTTATTLYVEPVVTFHTNGAGWVFNNGGGGGSFFSADNELTTTTAGGQQRAAWFTTPMYIGAFKASFVYRDVTTGGADGAAFVMQNAPEGLAAIGGGGGGLGYSGIAPSAALELNIYSPNTVGISVRTNGDVGGPYATTGPVSIDSGDPIQVSLDYSGGNLSITLSNQTTTSTFTTNIAINIPGAVGGSSLATIGVTAATGGVSAEQRISNFLFVPVPTLTGTKAGNTHVLTWPGTVGGYTAQTTPGVNPTSWAAVAGTVNQTNGVNYIVRPVSAGQDGYYRLLLPLP